MGIYGFGKAFNTRYVMGGQYSRRPHVNVRGGRPVMLGGSSFTKTTNVTINNGPTGFWGFMSGLFGGLFGGGLFGGLFGGGNSRSSSSTTNNNTTNNNNVTVNANGVSGQQLALDLSMQLQNATTP